MPGTPSTEIHFPDCDLCKNSGYLTYKAPPHYPMRECQFCECERGQAWKTAWERKLSSESQKRIDHLFAAAGIPSHFQSFTIDTLAERAKGDAKKLPAIEAIRHFAQHGFVADPNDKRYKSSIVVYGPYGCGKTGLITPLLRHALEQGKSALWVEVYDLIGAIQQGYSTGDSGEKLATAQRADVVLLDDLGDASRDREETEDRRRIIYQIINYRHNHNLPMLITTNCAPAQLSRQLGQRTMERIIESCAWITMGGRNLREEV